MDGGVADNVPILPLVKSAEVTNLVAIYLQTCVGRTEFLLKEVQRVESLSESIARSDISVDVAKHILSKEFDDLTSSEAKASDRRVVFVI